jgi:hypothetical protein
VNERPLRIVVFGYHTIGYRCLKELLDLSEEAPSSRTRMIPMSTSGSSRWLIWHGRQAYQSSLRTPQIPQG